MQYSYAKIKQINVNCFREEKMKSGDKPVKEIRPPKNVVIEKKQKKDTRSKRKGDHLGKPKTEPGPLKNKDHEKFSVKVASGINPTEAYRQLKRPCKDPRNASYALMKRLDIQDRIKEVKSDLSGYVNECEADIAKLIAKRISEHRSRIATVGEWRLHVMDMIAECKDDHDMVNNARFTEMLAKHLGVYDADNRQKAPAVLTQVNIEAGSDPKHAAEIYTKMVKAVE